MITNRTIITCDVCYKEGGLKEIGPFENGHIQIKVTGSENLYRFIGETKFVEHNAIYDICPKCFEGFNRWRNNV